MANIKTVFGDIPISRSFLGQHYKRWRQSKDAENFKGAELGCYCAYNDVDDEVRDQLRMWEAQGFPVGQ